MSTSSEETHFGDQTVPLADKQGLVDEVFHSVAKRYDLMNDLMSGGLHRAWKDALVTAVNPPAKTSDRPFALLDLAGGTGDIAFRAVEAGGPNTRVTVCDINAEMLAVGRERALERGVDDAVTFEQGNAEELPYPDQSFDCVTIAFGIRNVPRIAKALKRSPSRAQVWRPLPVPGIFQRRRARPRQDLRSLFLQGDPGDRPRRHRRPRGLCLSRRIDPQISQAEGLRADDRGRRLPPRLVSPP